MIVCSCFAVNEATIRGLGAHGARTVGDVMEASGAGSDCASCLPLIEAVLDNLAAPSGDFGPAGLGAIAAPARAVSLGSRSASGVGAAA